jgi:hypothetical protein
MKKLFTLIFFTVFGLMAKIGAQVPSDVPMVLQKCIDLPAIQQYFPVDNEGNLKQLRINYWHPLLFPVDLLIAKDGKVVQFSPMTVWNEQNGEAFFLFKKLIISQSASTVIFEYHYENNLSSKVVYVKIELHKVGESWEISDSEITNK